LRYALDHLLENAREAVAHERAERQQIVVQTRREGSCAFVEIVDRGPGIPGRVQADLAAGRPASTKNGLHGTGRLITEAIIARFCDGTLTTDTSSDGTTNRVKLNVAGATDDNATDLGC
jgi:sensor histidine kinase regulating citrate/malate metabolism